MIIIGGATWASSEESNVMYVHPHEYTDTNAFALIHWLPYFTGCFAERKRCTIIVYTSTIWYIYRKPWKMLGLQRKKKWARSRRREIYWGKMWKLFTWATAYNILVDRLDAMCMWDTSCKPYAWLTWPPISVRWTFLSLLVTVIDQIVLHINVECWGIALNLILYAILCTYLIVSSNCNH